MLKHLVAIGFALLLLAVAPICLAQCCAGTVAKNCTESVKVPQDFPTIQAAIDAQPASTSVMSQTGIIVVSPGVYNENVDYEGKALCITSTLSSDPKVQAAATSATIIDGGFRGPVVYSSSTATNATGTFSELDFFTIQHGGSPNSTNSMSSYGGINSAFGYPSIIYGNIIENNSNGGIIVSFTPTAPNSGTSLITNNTILGNTCWGVLTVGGNVGMTGNTISGTTTPAGGCSYSDANGKITTSNGSGVAVDDSSISYSYKYSF